MTEQELSRRARRRLAVIRHAQEATGNVALTCRYYGISRQIYYQWYRRYRADGLDGQPSRVHRCDLLGGLLHEYHRRAA